MVNFQCTFELKIYFYREKINLKQTGLVLLKIRNVSLKYPDLLESTVCGKI